MEENTELDLIETPAKEKKSLTKKILSHIYIPIIVIIVLLFNIFIGRIGLTVGESMMPTLNDSDFIYVNLREEVKRDDIIVINSETEGCLIKRVIALPGETIQIKHNIIFINGKPYDDRYNVIMKDYGIAANEIKLNENEYFVMGDNRNNSYDSRAFGPINENEIMGVVTHTVIPYKNLVQ